MRLFSIILITLGLHSFSNGQDSLDHNGSKANCDSIVLYPDKEPQIANYSSKLELVRELLMPIFEKHITEASFISKYYFICTINEEGSVIDIEIKNRIELPTELKTELENAIKDHTLWAPGIINKKPWCSKVIFAVNVNF